MIQLLESSGIGLVYGLRFYATGRLNEKSVLFHKYTDQYTTNISILFTNEVSVEKKSLDMQRQKWKQDILILKMLPKDVVAKLSSGDDTAENFVSATLFFSSVVDFDNVTKACKPLEVIGFLNNLYNTMDERMDKHDVYKVESISDSYLVASGLPKRNGDK